MFDLHPMRALFLMSKSGFKPPTLKEKERWSQIFHSFVKISLTKNPKKRPNAERLLQHPFVNGGGAGTGEMSVRLMRELLHKYQNPHQFSDGSEMDEDGAMALSVPQRIPSKMGTVQRAHLFGESSKMVSASNNNNSDQLSPPDTLPSEMSLSSYMDAQWDRMTLSSAEKAHHARGCNRVEVAAAEPGTSAMAASDDSSPKRHNSMDRLVGMFSDLGSAANRQRSLSDGEQQQPDILNNTPPVPPKRNKHRHRSPPPLHHPVSNGLPPTPKVLMGACFSKVFNGCPLHINCTASWINPETRDQHIIIGADEGIFNLNMNEIHDATIDQLYPRRTVWLYVIKDVLMSLSGASTSPLWNDNQKLTQIFFCRQILSIVSSRSGSTSFQANDESFHAAHAHAKNTREACSAKVRAHHESTRHERMFAVLRHQKSLQRLQISVRAFTVGNLSHAMV
jgi:hypothetical protein